VLANHAQETLSRLIPRSYTEYLQAHAELCARQLGDHRVEALIRANVAAAMYAAMALSAVTDRNKSRQE
jgi:hypothetical protein